MPHQLEHGIKGGGVRASLADHRLQILDGVTEHIRCHPVFMAGHPVLVAADGVDLAIVGQNAEGLGQLPGRHGVGRIALVIDREGRDETFVKKVGEEGGDLLGEEHALVDDRPAGHRTDVEVGDQLGRHGLFDTTAHDIQLALGLFLVDIGRHREHDLLDFRTGGVRLVAKRVGIHRHLAPAIDHMPDGQNFLLDNAAATFLGGKVGARQKHHAHGKTSAVIIMAGAGDMLDEEVARNFDMDAGTVACHAVGIHRAAVPDRLKGLDGGLDDGARRLAVTGGDKSHAAGVMLHFRAIDTGLGQPRLVAGAAGQIGGVVKHLVLRHGHNSPTGSGAGGGRTRRFALRRDIGMDGLGGITAVANTPDDQRGTANDVAGGKDAGKVCHHGAPVNTDGAPFRDFQLGRAEHGRNVLRIKAKRLDHQIGRNLMG